MEPSGIRGWVEYRNKLEKMDYSGVEMVETFKKDDLTTCNGIIHGFLFKS